MSITINSQPGLFSPVQSPMYFRVTSTNTSQCGFNYVFDIFTGNTDYKTRIVLQARLDGSCVFTPNTVLKSYLGYDLQPTSSSVKGASNSAMQYRVSIGEQYGLGNNCTTGVTTFSGITTQSGYCWNAVTQYKDFPTFKYTQFYMTGSTSRFLTNRPDNLKVNPMEWETISILNVNSGGTKVSGFLYTFASDDGSSVSQFFLSNPFSASTAGSAKLLNIPVGTANLEQAFLISFNYAAFNYYTIQATSGNSASTTGISEVRTFRFNDVCYKYPGVRLAFLNSLGGFEFFNFPMISRKFIDVEREKYQKILPYNYNVGNRARAVVETQAQESVTIGTDYISTEVSEWLIREFYTSPEVYEMQGDGTYLPITVEPGNKEIPSTFNDKLVQLSFKYTYAFDRGTTSGGGGAA